MRPALAHLPVMQHENLVGVDDGAQSVRHGDRRPSAHQLRQRTLNLRFDLAVDRARRLVEDEQRRIRGDRSREREQLSLADADRRAALAEHLRVPVRKAPNDPVRADARRRDGNVILGNGTGQPNVAQYVAGEEEDVLLHVSDQRTQIR